MARMPEILVQTAEAIKRHRGMILPAVLAGLVLVIVLPMPPVLMDVLLVASLALAAVILLTAILVANPLEFSLFPSILLTATLVRLVLNVGLTRLILTAGRHAPGAAEARLAAGSVVWAFSEYMPSGSLAVGVVLFCVLVAVQFIVVVKGGGRISEVAARFALDAMPGRQMSIDSDFNAGLITEEQARSRRDELNRQADFHGAMDGASKFLRGDVAASIIISVINILGGLYVGVAEYGWSWSEAAGLFARLTVGAGLATQLPAFLLATAAALLVTRTAGESNLGEGVLRQLSSRPLALGVAAALVGGLMLTSLPKIPLLLIAAGLGAAAWMLPRRRGEQAEDAEAPGPAAAPKADDVGRLLAVDPLRINIGFALVPLVDPERSAGPHTTRNGDLLERISALRAKIAEELGLLVPPIRIRDDMRMEAHQYSIEIRGGRVAEGMIYPNLLLAVGGAEVGERLGRPTSDPVFGAPAVWIRPDQRKPAEEMDCTVVPPANVLTTHLGEVLRARAADLLTREQSVRLLERLRTEAAHLVREVEGKLTGGQVQKVLQSLLRERVPIRDLETILEAVLEGADHTDDPAMLAERARGALSRTLSRQFCSEDGRLWCVSLRPEMEEAIGRYVSQGGARTAAVPPDVHEKITRAVAEGVSALAKQGRPPVVVCASGIRPAVSRLLSPALPGTVVLGYNEVDSVEVQTVAAIGTEL
ncbi:MAG TPA: flagellar biosynthesis protein FlhA [Phycisphaerae bacterium]|nr:flagellar biosynthesis protein FlhA [Phycisphaerae bacterium]